MIAAIEYLNSVPMVWGMRQAGLGDELMLLPPAQCAAAFKEHKADIALVPVGTLGELSTDLENQATTDAAAAENDGQPHIVTDFCIGASGAVRSVVIMGGQPIGDTHKILLDPQSRTSALLVRLLCRHLWKIEPEFATITDYNAPLLKGEAMMLIGDKVFEHEGRHAHTTDLAGEWLRLTGLPFVFAVWVARQKVPPSQLARLNAALAHGVARVAEAIEGRREEYALSYLTKNIDYRFDTAKKEALHTFKTMCDDYDIHAATQQHRPPERHRQT